MTVRVTVGSTAQGSLVGLESASSRLTKLQQKLSTGNQITRPSDDPAGTTRAMELRGDLRRNAQFTRNSADATGWLKTADTAYGQITDLMQKVRTLTVQGLNAGASTGTSAKAIGEQISSIRDAVLKLSNTTYNGRPIFGGTTNGGVAFALSDPNDPTSTITYQGDDGQVNRRIGNQNTVQINQTGTDAFGTDASGGGLFALLDRLASNLDTGGTPTGGSVTDPLASIDDAINKLSSARSASGAALHQVESAQQTQASDKVSLKSNLSQIQDIDLAQTVIEMNTAKVTYQAALQTTANIRQLSLMDFLR